MIPARVAPVEQASGAATASAPPCNNEAAWSEDAAGQRDTWEFVLCAGSDDAHGHDMPIEWDNASAVDSFFDITITE